MKHLPAHPTMVHPKTGKPLRALFIDRHGRPRYPILGASPDDPDDKPDDDGKDKPDDPDDKPDDDGKDKPDDLGFPADTAVAEMTEKQQAAYWKHQSRTHEGRAKSYRSAAGGKTPDELKGIVSEAEKARRSALSVDDKALEDARNEGRTALLSELGPKAVRSAFDLLLGDMPKKDKDEHLDVLDLSKFLTDDHEVDTAKVRSAVRRMQPDKGQGTQSQQQRDYGQGTRGGGAPGGSIAAVREAREQARAEKAKK